MRKQRVNLLSIASISLASFLIALPLWTSGIPNPDDFLMSVHRVFELESAWRQGIYFPRFGPDLNFGYGAPLFQFYPPLASYLALAFFKLGLGYIGAAKAVLTFSMLMGAIGTYHYANFLLHNRVSAVSSALLYLISPYLLTVVYERGAIAESLTWALLPWLVWSVHALYAKGERKYFLLVSVFVAALIVGHNTTALIVAPGIGLLALFLGLYNRHFSTLLPLVGAFLLGLGISAFYWAPALWELNLVTTRETMFSGDTDVTNNIVPVVDVIQHKLIHQYAGPQRFRFSLWQFVAGMISIVILTLQREKIPATIWLMAVVWGVILFLQTNLAIAFWRYAPLVDSIQFPWRLYGIASFSIAILIGAAIAVTEPPQPGWRGVRFVLLGTFIFMVWTLSTANASPQKSLLWTEMDEEEITRNQIWTRGLTGYALFEDYALSTMAIPIPDLTKVRHPDDPSIRPSFSIPQISVIAENPQAYVLDINAQKPWTLRLHRPYFPGWQIYQNGTPVTTVADGAAGIVTAALPAGEYRVLARFGSSPVRTFANTLSIFSLGIWFTVLMRKTRGRFDIILVVLLVIAANFIIWRLTESVQRSYHPTAFEARFENDLALLAFNIHGEQFCTGESMVLRLYWFSGTTPKTNLSYFIHVVTLDDTVKVGQVDSTPFDGFNPMTRWESGELIVDEQELLFDELTEPGRYQLLVGLYDPVTVQNQQVLFSPDTLPGDRLKLTELELIDCSD